MNHKGLAGALALSVAIFASPASQADVLYDNGPDTLVGGWTIASGFSVADSFTLSSSAALTGIKFSNWQAAGNSAEVVYWFILDGSPASGGHLLRGGTACATDCSPEPGSAHTLAELSSQAGAGHIGGETFDVDEEAITLPGLDLAAGTYWLELQADETHGGLWGISDGSSTVWESEFINNITSGICTELFGPTVTSCSNSFQILGTNGVIPAPEPSSLALLGAALGCLGAARGRKKERR